MPEATEEEAEMPTNYNKPWYKKPLILISALALIAAIAAAWYFKDEIKEVAGGSAVTQAKASDQSLVPADSTAATVTAVSVVSGTVYIKTDATGDALHPFSLAPNDLCESDTTIMHKINDEVTVEAAIGRDGRLLTVGGHTVPGIVCPRELNAQQRVVGDIFDDLHRKHKDAYGPVAKSKVWDAMEQRSLTLTKEDLKAKRGYRVYGHDLDDAKSLFKTHFGQLKGWMVDHASVRYIVIEDCGVVCSGKMWVYHLHMKKVVKAKPKQRPKVAPVCNARTHIVLDGKCAPKPAPVPQPRPSADGTVIPKFGKCQSCN